MAFDRMGNLFVGQIPVDNAGIYTGGSCYINEFINTSAGLSTTATVFAVGLGNIGSLAFDASGNLFETEEDSGKLNEFINAGGTLSSTPIPFATGLGTAAGMAIHFSPDVRSDWYISTAGGTPQINIANLSLSTPASLVISWPATATGNGYVVQTNGDLTTANWADYGGTVNSNQGTNSLTITPTTGNLFFRLAVPETLKATYLTPETRRVPSGAFGFFTSARPEWRTRTPKRPCPRPARRAPTFRASRTRSQRAISRRATRPADDNPARSGRDFC